MIVIKLRESRRGGDAHDARGRLRGAHRRGRALSGRPMRYISNTAGPAAGDARAPSASARSRTCSSRIPPRRGSSRPLQCARGAWPRADLDPPPPRPRRRRTPTPTTTPASSAAAPTTTTIPSPINHLISRGEFFTAPTRRTSPRRARARSAASSSTRRMIAELDAAWTSPTPRSTTARSSLAEAALMAHAVTERDAIVLSQGVNPLYRQVVETYCEGPGIRLKIGAARRRASRISTPSARPSTGTDRRPSSSSTRTSSAASEDVQAAAEIAHARGRAARRGRGPGQPRPARRRPARSAPTSSVGEGQGLGVPMSFGGPNLGVFARRSRSWCAGCPAALVGATVDRRRPARLRAHAPDPRAAHPPREGDLEHLHQRRALRADGDDLPRHHGQATGSRQVGELSAAKAHYAAAELAKIPGVRLRFARAVLQGVHARAPEVARSAW